MQRWSGTRSGGAVALSLAARHPELVARLVLVDALCYDAPLGVQQRLALVPLVGGLVFKQLWGYRNFRAYFRERVLLPGAPVPSERIEHYYRLFNTPAARGSALATLRATVDTRPVIARPAASRRRRWSSGAAATGSSRRRSASDWRGRSAARASSCWTAATRRTKKSRASWP